MIKIKVKSFNRLLSQNKDVSNQDFTEFEFADNPEIRDVLQRLGINKPAGLFILVNDRIATIEKKLDSGDMVKIYPHIIGG